MSYSGFALKLECGPSADRIVITAPRLWVGITRGDVFVYLFRRQLFISDATEDKSTFVVDT